MNHFYTTRRPALSWPGVPSAVLRLSLTRGGELIRSMLLAEGLFLLIFTVGCAVTTVALEQPWLMGSVEGGYRADMTILTVGCMVLLLLGGLLFLLIPRAVSVLYEELSCRFFGVYRADRALSREAGRAMEKCYRTWWALAAYQVTAFLLGTGTALITKSLWPGLALWWLVFSFGRLAMPIQLFEGKRGFPALFSSMATSLRHLPGVLLWRILLDLPGKALLLVPAALPFFLLPDVFLSLVAGTFCTFAALMILRPFYVSVDTVLYQLCRHDQEI